MALRSVNRNEKGAKDASEWEPEHNRRWFAEQVFKVKEEWELSIDPAERTALDRLLRTAATYIAQASWGRIKAHLR